ncbi:MAG: ABC transporter ATP-binding protein [Thermodesulfobacteriota bacterium]
MSQVALAIDAVSKVYNSGVARVLAVEAASAAFATGSITAIMGPSGSGKTTLLSILGLILRPSSGRVQLLGQDVTGLDEGQLPALRRTHIGFIFQSFNLFSALSALDNVLVALQIKGVGRRQAVARAQEALARVGLASRVGFLPRDLSGGEKQRVSIARAIAADAPIILADEPTANLDSRTGMTIVDLLSDLAREQAKTVVVVTHDLRLQEHVDRVLFMEDGLLKEGAHG